MTRLEVTTRVAAPPQRVFDLCLDVDGGTIMRDGAEHLRKVAEPASAGR